MTAKERVMEMASVAAIAAIMFWVEHRTGKGMLALVMDAMPPLPGIETITP